MDQFTLVIVIIAVALVFDFVNGAHDAANSIATVVSTGVLPMTVAVIAAGLVNYIGGVFFGTSVAMTISKDILQPHASTLVVILAALVGAIAWNVITWLGGIPSSSSHALMGGLMGAGYAGFDTDGVKWLGLGKIVLSLILSPLLGMFFGILIMAAVLWVTIPFKAGKLEGKFRFLQIASALSMAAGHGANDAQKTMGIITMALLSAGYIAPVNGKIAIPFWVINLCSAVIALGTFAGGKKMIGTVGRKIYHMKPFEGFAAEFTAATVIFLFSRVGLPVSTTHVITGAILGVGSSKSISLVGWGVTGTILLTWCSTILASGFVSGLSYLALKQIFGA